MKANSLTIGNIVKGISTEYCIIQCVGLTETHGILRNSEGSFSSSWHDIHLVEGVEINEYWLKKLGLTERADGTWHDTDRMSTFRIIYDKREKACFFATDVYPELGHRVYLPGRMEYVHELQNTYFFLFDKQLQSFIYQRDRTIG